MKRGAQEDRTGNRQLDRVWTLGFWLFYSGTTEVWIIAAGFHTMELRMTPERFERRMDFLLQSIESHDRQIAELVDNGARLDARIAAQSENIDKLVQVTNEDANAIRTLARIADLHQKRLDRIEGISSE